MWICEILQHWAGLHVGSTSQKNHLLHKLEQGHSTLDYTGVEKLKMLAQE